ncbi:nitroreductase family protein [Paenibacillus woosongensis]|uniref:NAD(P)H nitroreductase YdgI n=1 Tax=Paenibacillus woosongensis TaxID=307580 RepID=A0AA95I9Z0_9BACL|nr:nitroreductase family protein [Paenibacillus woosongensis]WHX50488.1 nitroreductase family protein [Paenibacillus woosongensis]GIP57172.1 putative NAD(P)H nitroreductase YdgI [Paenibacillus woosongensis]
MSTITAKDFKEIVLGRRSVKNYDPAVKISREEMTEILAEATTAPSSINMQPWRFVVIDTPEGKAKLAELAMYNTNQVNTSAAVIAVFGDMKCIENADEIYGKSVELGYMPEDVKEKLVASFKPMYENLPEQNMRDIVLIDASLVSMQLMLVARAHGYDTNPIGGYDKQRIAEAFGLEKERYVPIMLISIGKAATEGRPSYRLPVEAVTTWK